MSARGVKIAVALGILLVASLVLMPKFVFSRSPDAQFDTCDAIRRYKAICTAMLIERVARMNKGTILIRGAPFIRTPGIKTRGNFIKTFHPQRVSLPVLSDF